MPHCVRRPFHAFVVPIVACGLALAAPPGCGGPDRPMAFDDVVILQPSADGSGTVPINLGGAPHVPMCNLGPEGGVCACADEPLLVDAPNIYFVLDRSGSMKGLKWANIQAVLETLVIALGPRASVGATVFPDPNSDGCTPGIQVFAPQRGDSPAGTPGPTEAALITALSRIPAAGGTPTAVTLSEVLPILKSLAGKTYVVLATDGGPNCNANAVCGPSQCTYNIENTTGCSPGGPSCCTDPNNGGPLACLDAQPTIDAVRAIAGAGIPVYVVGVPGSDPYASLLDQLAQAGGTARDTKPLYYAIDTADQAAFLATLSSIAAKITGSCTLDLGNVPPDPGQVNVFFDEQVLPQAGPDGWTLDGSTVTIHGASCQKILGGNVLDVRVVAGCPTVTL